MSVVSHELLPGPAGAATVVLSNSLGSTRHMWDHTVPALQEQFNVLRYDTRGHGLSTVIAGSPTIDDLADDVIALLDHLGLERVHFVGLSLGGMTGMRLAARNPERVNRFVALCTSPYLGPATNWTDRAALVRRDGTAAVAEAVVDRWYSPGFLASQTERVRRARAMVASTPAEGYADCCDAIATMDLRAQLSEISAPTLAIAGADDPSTGPDHLAQIADGVRDGRLVVVPDAAHLANDEQPEIVNAAIITHLTGGTA